MNEFEKSFEKEAEIILTERKTYPGIENNLPNKVYDYLSLIFLISGFVALILIFFTNVTLLQATCLFVISYIVKPTDTDRRELENKCMAEDLAHIRMNTTIIGKHIKKIT